MPHDPLDLTDEQIEELDDAITTISEQTGGCVYLPEYDGTSKTIALTVELVGPTEAELRLIPTYVAGFPVRVIVRKDLFDEGEVLFLPSVRSEEGIA